MGYNKKSGFSIIELIMSMVIIGILSVTGVSIMLYLVQNSVFIPNKLNMDMLGSEVLDNIIEGIPADRGLRFSRSISIAEDNRVIFKNQNSQEVIYNLDVNTGKLYRSIAGGPYVLFPYYSFSGVKLAGKNNKLFTYYDALDAEVSNPADVRRIKITLVAKTGSGSFADWQGMSEQCSSIAVNKFE